MATFKSYLRLLRLERTFYFVEILLGVIFALNFDLSKLNFVFLIQLFFLFQGMYAGLYIINDIVDYKKDKLHPIKSKRVIASGEISRNRGLLIALILIILSISISFFVNKLLFYFEIFFIIYNQIYTFLLKKITCFVPFSNAVTHCTRFVMGMILFGVFDKYLLALALFFLSFGLTSIKKYEEIKVESSSNKKKFEIIYLIFIIIPFFIISSALFFASSTEKLGILFFDVFYLLYILVLFFNKSKNLLIKFLFH